MHPAVAMALVVINGRLVSNPFEGARVLLFFTALISAQRGEQTR
jgi:hypothetical protein